MTDSTQMSSYRDVRRPKELSDFLTAMTNDGSPFPTFRDVLLFAAAYGWSQHQRVAFESSAEPIRWSTMTNRLGAEDLINLIATAETDDMGILAASRAGERIQIFEEYAHGGLLLMQELVRRQPAREPADLLIELTKQALINPEDETGVSQAEIELAKLLVEGGSP